MTMNIKGVCLVVGMCVLAASLPSGALAEQECASVNGDMILNKCLKTTNGFLNLLALNIMQWVNPRTIAITTLGILIVLPALLILNNHSEWYFETRRKFVACRLVVIHFLYRICYALVLDVALYAVFRQQRPCACLQGIDSRYGMPSGDAMAAGILGAYLLDCAPFFKIGSRVAGFLLIVAVAFERVVLGYHSIGQVSAGIAIGVALHFYATRVPQYALFIDAFIQWTLGAVVLHVDNTLVYERNDPNNLWAWFLWGASFQVFALLMLLRHSMRSTGSLRMLRTSAHAIDSTSLAPSELEQLLLNSEIKTVDGMPERQDHHKVQEDADVRFMLLALAVLLVLNFLASCSQYYGWLVTTN